MWTGGSRSPLAGRSTAWTCTLDTDPSLRAQVLPKATISISLLLLSPSLPPSSHSLIPSPFSILLSVPLSPLSLTPLSPPFFVSLSALFSLPPPPFLLSLSFLGSTFSLSVSPPLPGKDNTMKTDTLTYASQVSTPTPTQLYFRSPGGLCALGTIHLHFSNASDSVSLLHS